MDLNQKYFRKLKLLNETIWENKVSKNKIDNWLNNFRPEERNEALYLLSQFIYFSEFSVERLLNALYRDLFKYKITSKIRLENENTLDCNLISEQFKLELSQTRFVSLGNPSESSATLMGLMRKVNRLPVNLFISEENINVQLGQVRNFIFIDDLCGSGSQAVGYSKKSLPGIKKLFPDAKIWYLMLIATTQGKKKIKLEADFDFVDSIYELDTSYKCFDESSRIFTNKDKEIQFERIKNFTGIYGKKLMASIIQKTNPNLNKNQIDAYSEKEKFGFGDGQLMLGFHHNTPDNTLPIVWYNEDHQTWQPIFKRSHKVYGL